MGSSKGSAQIERAVRWSAAGGVELGGDPASFSAGGINFAPVEFVNLL
jgi:hypothetical protein